MIHCQNCTTRNAMTRQFCWKCGTKLLVPSGAAPSDSPMSFMDEHVLERISAMEYALSMIHKRLDSMVETVERVAANNFIDHTMIETLTESLEGAGIDLSNLEADWQKRVQSRMVEREEVDRLGSRMEQIIAFYRGPRRKQFMLWIERAYELLASDRPEESLGSLESAFEHDPSNFELGMLLAEVFFGSQDFGSARRCLSQVLQARPDHFEATLLMGLLETRQGNLAEAQKLLEGAVRLKDDSPSAHATLGSLFMDRGNRPKAIAHLNRALELKPSAPAHFMLGAIHYQDGRQRHAIRHLKQATLLDPEFGEAFYQLGLLCLEMKWGRKAQDCFERAQRLNPGEVRYRLHKKKKKSPGYTESRKIRSFSEARLSPDQLSGLVRDELHLAACWNVKRK